jgi:hypothetical protein
MIFIPTFPFPHVPKTHGNEKHSLKAAELLDFIKKISFPFPFSMGTANEIQTPLEAAENNTFLDVQKFVPVPVLPLYYVEYGSWEQPYLRTIKNVGKAVSC